MKQKRHLLVKQTLFTQNPNNKTSTQRDPSTNRDWSHPPPHIDCHNMNFNQQQHPLTSSQYLPLNPNFNFESLAAGKVFIIMLPLIQNKRGFSLELICTLHSGWDVVCGCVVRGRGSNVSNNVRRVGGRAVESWGVASSRYWPPVDRGREARVVGRVVRVVGGMWKRRCRGCSQVGAWGWSFIWQVEQWERRREGRLIWVEESRGGGGAWRSRTDGGGAFHGDT